MTRHTLQSRILETHRRERIRDAMTRHGNDAGGDLLIDTALEQERLAYQAVWDRHFAIKGAC